MLRRSFIVLRSSERLFNDSFKVSRPRNVTPLTSAEFWTLSCVPSEGILRSSQLFNAKPQDFRRYKSKKSKQRAQDSDSDSSDDESNESLDPGEKLITCRVTSLRADSLIKSGLGITKRKTEEMFYESKLRINGQKIHKKSVKITDGDEIDVIKGPSQSNPNLLTIGRVEIVKIRVNDDDDGFIVKVKRFKNLTVENYEGSNAWTASSV